jgi:hypothetical protein
MLPWLLIATVVGVGVWMGVDYLGRTGPEAQRAVTDSPSPTKASEPSASDTELETPAPAHTPPDVEVEKTPEHSKTRLITEGITVQVLNGTADPEAGEAMAERLRGLGFNVVAVEFSSTNYKETTVFWSVPESQDAAEALAERFGWASDLKPGNLADTVSMHVVVGKDEV